jgi:hypothetical protein
LQLCLFELLKTKKYTMNESNIEILWHLLCNLEVWATYRFEPN